MLRFERVDYFARAWPNEQLLGEHEGYPEPFEFEGALGTLDRLPPCWYILGTAPRLP